MKEHRDQLQVRQGDQPWYPIQDRSFVAHGGSRMPCAAACKLGTETKIWTCDKNPSEQGLPPHPHTHTHPHRSRQGDVLAHEVKVRMKRGWDESEDEMRLLNRDTRRGTQKKREGANTNTNTPGRKRANPERAREEKTEADGNRNGARPAKKGRMEAPEPTYHSETYAYLARTGPNLPGEGRMHEIGDRMGN